MSSNITGITLGGSTYEPAFVIELDQLNCISCGRCYKVCARNVLELVERTAEFQVKNDDEDDDDDWDDDDEDSDNTMMAIVNQLDCIGCEACARVCPKKCFTNAPRPVQSAAA